MNWVPLYRPSNQQFFTKILDWQEEPRVFFMRALSYALKIINLFGNSFEKAFDIGAMLSDHRDIILRSDHDAIKSDFEAVGKDMRNTYARFAAFRPIR